MKLAASTVSVAIKTLRSAAERRSSSEAFAVIFANGASNLIGPNMMNRNVKISCASKLKSPPL